MKLTRQFHGAYATLLLIISICVYQQLAYYPQALKYQRAALLLAEEKKEETQQAYTLVNMANTYLHTGDCNNGLQSVEIEKSNNKGRWLGYRISDTRT